MFQKRLPQVASKRKETFVSNVVWDQFVDWCLHKSLKPIPAHSWALAAYTLTLEGRMSPAQIRKCLAKIGKAHAEKSKSRPDRDPLIEKTIKTIENRAKPTGHKAKTLDDEDFSDPRTPKVKKTNPTQKSAMGPKNKKPPSRAMRGEPKLVMKRSLRNFQFKAP